MEKTTKEKLEDLMKEWKNYSKKKWPGEPFVEDGAFDHYENQPVKILFIARESYGKEDNDYITERQDGGMKMTPFHARQLYIAYGILHGECNDDAWLEMKCARELNNKFGEENGFSFAFINASKLNNNSGSTDVKSGSFFEFIADPKNRELFLKEIEILSPDIIISGNLGDVGFMEPFLGKESKDERIKVIDAQNKNFLYYELRLGERTIPWLDGWHFSAPKSTFENFYKPICSKAKEILKNKK